MKSNQKTDLGRSLARLTILVVLAAMISSCSTGTSNLDPAKHTVPAISNSWVKVRSKPPTWYPRGVAADHPTDFNSGSMIYAEDSLNTRFFIPTHGLLPELRKKLKAEALAARHPARIQKNANEKTNRTAGTVLTTIFVQVPLNIFLAMGRP